MFHLKFLKIKSIKKPRRKSHDDDEIAKYLTGKREKLTTDPMLWCNQQSSFPELKNIALGYMLIPTSQAGVERNFSYLSFILNPLRNRLSQENLKYILFLKISEDLL